MMRSEAKNRFSDKVQLLSVPLTADDKLGKPTFSSKINVTWITKFGISFVIGLTILLTYTAGYSNGVKWKKKTLVNDEEYFGLREGEASKKLRVIEQVDGFSQTYPKYDTQSNDLQDVQYPMEHQEISLFSDSSEEELSEEESSENEPIILTSSLTDEELFSNYDDYKASPYITVPNVNNKYNLPYSLPKKNLWWGVKAYEQQYRSYPVKRVVPRLKRDVQLTAEEFHVRFRRVAQPVVFNFENLRHLGYPSQNYSLKELKLMFPYDEKATSTSVQAQFVANGVRKADEELDLGPGLVAIERDEELAKKGKLRSFPRNLKVKAESIRKLNIKKPPLVKGDDESKDLWQLPTVWMGTSSSDTRFHHDCCDNFVMMITGTKRFTLAPTSDWRILNPQCIGKLKALCWANVNDPNSRTEGVNKKGTEASLQYLNKMIVDVGPGDVLYMPAGWWHHIQNLGPTLMVNWWTKGAETCGLMRARKSPSY